MKIGTKSVLFGAHCFFLHPFFVARAWHKLWGWGTVRDTYVTTSLRDPRLWLAFFLHDLGYIGKPNMDGPEGERHVWPAANLMRNLFGDCWRDFCLYHSRFYAKQHGVSFSALCVADKLSFGMTPAWIYLPMVRATGEVYEYMSQADSGKYQTMNVGTSDFKTWRKDVDDYMSRWAWEHKDLKQDHWTPETGNHERT